MRKNFSSIKYIRLTSIFLLICLQSPIFSQIPESKASFKDRFSRYAPALTAVSVWLSDAQMLQNNFSIFVNRERDCFEYDAAKALANELGAHQMNLADITFSIEKTIEKLIHKIIEPYENGESTIDTIGLKIQYMMLFLAAIFQNDRECGRCIFETYIKILGLDTADDGAVMNKKHEGVAS